MHLLYGTVYSVKDYKPFIGPAGAAPRWSVFLSHSGAEKRCFVDCLNLFLRFEGIPTFMDERSLQPGKHAWFAIETALAEAPVGKLQFFKVCCTTRKQCWSRHHN